MKGGTLYCKMAKWRLTRPQPWTGLQSAMNVLSAANNGSGHISFAVSCYRSLRTLFEMRVLPLQSRIKGLQNDYYIQITRIERIQNQISSFQMCTTISNEQRAVCKVTFDAFSNEQLSQGEGRSTAPGMLVAGDESAYKLFKG